MNGEDRDQSEMLSVWRLYFRTLLNIVPDAQKPPYELDASVADLVIHTGNFTLEKVDRTVRRLKNGGAPGSDYARTPCRATIVWRRSSERKTL